MAEFTYTGENSRLRKSDLKTINGTSIVGSGDIVISGGGSGDTNVIETVKVNGTALTPDANKAVDIVESVHVYPITSTELFEDLAVDTIITGVISTDLDIDIANGKLPILLFKVSSNAEPEPAILGYYGANQYYFYNVLENQIFYLTLEHTSQSTTLTVKERGTINIIKNLTINGSTKNISARGNVNLGTYIESVKVNGTTLTPDSNKAVDISVPTKTSDLTNDSNFTTLSEVTQTIVNSAPTTLDTLNELAAALGNDANFATTVATQIGQKYTKPNTGIPASDLADGVIPTIPVQSVNGLTGAVIVKENVQADWNATTGDAVILNKPIIPDEKLSSSYQTSTLENNNLLLVGGDTYEEAFSKIEKAILDNEETIAASLNDLNTRKIEIDNVPTKTSDLTNDSGFLTSYNETDPTVQSWAKNPILFTNPTVPNSDADLSLYFKGVFKNSGEYEHTVINLKNSENDVITNIFTSNISDVDWLYSYDDSIPTLGLFKEKLSEKYTKLSTGIPKTDLDSSVQSSLEKADTALQSAPVTSVNGQTGAVNLTIPAAVTESTVSGWGFTKNLGTYNKPSDGIPKGDLADTVQTSLGKADTALQSYTETDPTVPAWAKASTKPTYTAAEVGALPDTYTPPVTSVNGQTGAVSLTIPSAPGTLNTTAITAQSTSSSEALSGNITLHKIAKTGTYSDLIGTPNLSAYVIDYGSSGVGKIHGNVSEIEETRLYAASTTGAYVAVTPGGVDIDTTSLLSFGDVSVTTRTGAKLKYNNNEVATVNQIPTVNNATLTIQKNGTTVDTFTANASSNVTANIQINELPTVSSSDNGKILQVVNGAWALVTPVTVYTGTSTPDNSQGNDGDLYLLTS